MIRGSNLRKIRRQKRSYLIPNIAIFVSGIVALGVGLVFPVSKEYVEHIDVPSKVIATYTLNLREGEEIDGSFTIRGFVEKIGFYIKDPEGNRIYDAGTVEGQGKFRIVAENSGFYTLYFDNSLSNFDKSIYLQYHAHINELELAKFCSILLGLLCIISATIYLSWFHIRKAQHK